MASIALAPHAPGSVGGSGLGDAKAARNANAVVIKNMNNAPANVLLKTAGDIIHQQVSDSALLRAHLQRHPSHPHANEGPRSQSKLEAVQEQANLSRYQQLPRFERSEVSVGKILGRGGFCIVHDVDKLKGAPSSSSGGVEKSKAGTKTVFSALSIFSKLRRRKKRHEHERHPSRPTSVDGKKRYLPTRDHDSKPGNGRRNSRRSRGRRRAEKGRDEDSQQGSLRLESEFDDMAFDESRASAKNSRSTSNILHDEELQPAQAVDFSLSKDFLVAKNSGKKDTASKSSANRSKDRLAGRLHGNRFHPNTASTKYVLKRVAAEYQREDKITFLKGTVDLAMEAHYLSALHHPNIIALVGMSAAEPHHEEGYFILVEKLVETLTKRFTRWTTMDRACKGITGILVGSKKKVAKLFKQRMDAAYGIAAGGNYLHQQRIIFRDLKPDNIGFDSNNVLKLFDFGLAREVQEKDRLKDGLYRMTGMTGAIRYMAPEVGLNRPYNLSADVYSWAMIMWFILALEPPFGFYTQDMIYDRVLQRGSRPAIFKSWPTDIALIMQRAWDVNIRNRPSFSEIQAVIKQEMYDSVSSHTSTVTAYSD